MSNNTRSNSALAPHRGLSQAMPPAAKLEIEIPSTTQQRPEATNASGSLNPASIPLPSSPPYEDLLNEWIVFPDENQPKEVSVPAKHNLDEIPVANHDDHAEKGQVTTPLDGPTPPTGGDQFDAGALLRPSGTASGAENQVASLNREAVFDWDSCFKDNEELYADIAAMMMVNDSTQPQTEQEINTVGNVVSSNPTQESLDVYSQSIVDPTSHPAAISAHKAERGSIVTPASGLSLDSAAVTIHTPSTTTNNSQPSGMETPLGPVVALSNGPAEHLGSGSVINIFNGNNTVNMSYYQTPSGVANPPQLPPSHDQTGTTPAATPVLATPPPTPGNAPVQPHMSARAPASKPPRTLAPRPRPRRGQQGLPNSTFRPTPLKQSWTLGDLEVGEPTAGDPSNSPIQFENTALNQLATAQAISGPVEAYGPAQPQAPAQTGLKYANHCASIQQPQSLPRRDTNSKVNPHWPRPARPFQVKRAAKVTPRTKSGGPTGAPTRSYTQALQNVQTTPAQQARLHTPIRQSYLVNAGDFRPARSRPDAHSYLSSEDGPMSTYLVPVDDGGWILIDMEGNQPILARPCEEQDPAVSLPSYYQDTSLGDWSYPPSPSGQAPEPIYEPAEVYAAPTYPRFEAQQPQQHIAQPLAYPVQRSYSAPSLTVQAPEGLFTPSASPSAGFKPSGDDTFSLAYWQNAPLNPGPSRHPFAPAPIYGYAPPSHAPYTRASASVPGPSTLTCNNPAYGAMPLASQSSSSLSSLSSSSLSASYSSHSPVASPAPTEALQHKHKKRRVATDDDEIQEIPSSEYHSSDFKGKRVKRSSD